MPVIDTQQDFNNGKSNDKTINSSENNALLNVHSSNPDSDSKPHILTQKAVDGQNEKYIAPLTKQLEYLTRLIKGMSSFHQTNLPPRASTSAN